MRRPFAWPALVSLTLLVSSGEKGVAQETAPASAEDGRIVKDTLSWRDEQRVEHDYLVFLPEGYGGEEGIEKKRWPMIVYLHGGGGTRDSVKKRLQPLAKEPFVFLAPICPPLREEVEGYYHDWNPKILGAIIGKVLEDYAIDAKRCSLMGFSMGGSAAWETPFWHPDLFNKVVVISGSCHPWQLRHYPEIPVRVYSGETEFWLPQHKNTVNTAKHFGIDVTHTVWPDAGHGECCKQTLGSEELWRWLRGEDDDDD